MAEVLRRIRKRRPKLLLVSVVLVLFAFWAGQKWIAYSIEAQIGKRLGQRGLAMDCGSLSWSPWNGLQISDVLLRYRQGGPIVGTDRLAIDFPLRQFIGRNERLSYWRTSDASVSVYDAKGKVTLEKVTMEMEARGRDLTIRSAKAKKDGLQIDVEGTIVLKTRKPGHPIPQIRPQLQAVRATLEALDIRADTGPLLVTGNFTVDARSKPYQWTAQLHGKGQALEWKRIPLKAADVDASLGSQDSTIDAKLELIAGNSTLSLKRANWREAPFVFEGTLADSSDRADRFHGSYQGREKLLTIEKIEGNADLLSIAKEIPFIVEKIPKQISFERFPAIEITDVQRKSDGEATRWNIRSVDTKGVGVLRIGERDLEIRDLAGSAEYDGKAWKLKGVKADVFGGRVDVDGIYDHPQLSGAEVKVRSAKLIDIMRWLNPGKKSSNESLLSIDYQGDVDAKNRDFDGAGSMRLENAPVIEVPILDQTYELFGTLFSGLKRSEKGEFTAEFTSRDHLVNVSQFVAKGGSLTVTAKGTANLKTKRVDGTAQGNLVGLPGIFTKPLSQLLEMDVGGPFDKIQVQPRGPVEAVKGTAEKIGGAGEKLKDAIEEKTGNSSEPKSGGKSDQRIRR